MRPTIFNFKAKRTAWLDFKTGRGVTDDGTTIRPKIGDRRKNPNLADLLDTAHALGAERIMLTGAVPETIPGKSHWLIVRTPGWTAGGHWLNKPVTGRFTNDVSGNPLEVRTVEEWFGTNDLKPIQARDSWMVTAQALADAVPDAVMGLTPARTGATAWARSLPRKMQLEPMPRDLADELHFTSGQHRIEHLTSGPDRCDCGSCLPLLDAEAQPEIDTFSYVDGRFMYAACCRELGTMPARRMGSSDAADLLVDDPYVRARFRVSVEVPDGWDHVGLLGAKHEDVSAGWHYPNRPGATFETWADGAELKLARDNGWYVRPLEAVTFTKARPLDTFADRMTRARERVNARQELEPEVRRAVAAALRAMLIQTIGNFASRLKGRTITVWSAREVPAEYAHTMQRFGDAFTYQMPGREHDDSTLPYYQPHLAAQVWSRARARVLRSPVAGQGAAGGVLSMDPGTLLGINGDAIYSTAVPQWARHVDDGGGDDGRVGRLRLKGVLTGAIATPVTMESRNALRAKAEAVGVPGWESDV